MIRFILTLLIGLVWVAPSFLNAQDYRESVPIPSVYIYQKMLSYADSGENDKILKLLASIKEILNAINSNFGEDLETKVKQAIATGNKEVILKALYTLIHYDIKDVFRATIEGIKAGKPLSKLKGTLKLAYLDYLLVSQKARKKDFNLDREIRKDFTELLTADLARAVSQDDIRILQNKFDSIEYNYRSIFGL